MGSFNFSLGLFVALIASSFVYWLLQEAIVLNQLNRANPLTLKYVGPLCKKKITEESTLTPAQISLSLLKLNFFYGVFVWNVWSNFDVRPMYWVGFFVGWITLELIEFVILRPHDLKRDYTFFQIINVLLVLLLDLTLGNISGAIALMAIVLFYLLRASKKGSFLHVLENLPSFLSLGIASYYLGQHYEFPYFTKDIGALTVWIVVLFIARKIFLKLIGRSWLEDRGPWLHFFLTLTLILCKALEVLYV